MQMLGCKVAGNYGLCYFAEDEDLLQIDHSYASNGMSVPIPELVCI